ncbi:ubiquinol-cytochrome c reductase complex assembly factor 2 [Aspergillus ruber CBS 135680]|uniref:Uncharacterized protein n=1 Tax=Aspergillus ruber (strain CBS 135680) TaxID=1388766 RepID=A0A017S280_ASPRC|nr:uncharacterized protein EURHEDRAFT_389802 [Aspergillus ruber CBS 135680]EYE91138.1 hypothetical protein EURHEDRAFT_389802 [Aspergillus ruber CBS 135680]
MSKPPVRPQTLQTRISHLLSHWPSDPVRPASVSVQTYLQTRVSQASTQNAAASQQQQHLPQNQQPQEMSEASLNALSSLLEDRYTRRYPLSQKLRRPASSPDHYDNVVREFEEAPERDWFGRLGKRLKGLLRFS